MAISVERIKVCGLVNFQEVFDLKFIIEPNKHASLQVSGIISDEEYKKALHNQIANKISKVKVKLDIDEKQSKETAYTYEWTPDMGSVMYCMPMVGTRVSLYFSNEDEQCGRIVNCVRENGNTCSAMSDPSMRTLTSEHGKQVFLYPETMGFLVEEAGNRIELADSEAITLVSQKKVSIQSEQEIIMKAKTIRVEKPSELKVKHTG